MRSRAVIARGFWSRVDQRALRWFAHVERMDEYHIARRVLMAEVSGRRVWDGPRLALGSREMKVLAASQCSEDKEWRTLVHM